MIVVVGRPALAGGGTLSGLPALIAQAAVAAGARAELVGSVGDDPAGDAVAVALGRAGVGHAALLRDPAGATPIADGPSPGPMPRLEAADLELGMSYLLDCRVLVVAEPLEDRLLAVARDAARYQGARLIVLLPSGAAAPRELGAEATVLEAADDDATAFAELVGRYAAELAAGRQPSDAWEAALSATGWQESEADAEPDPEARER